MLENKTELTVSTDVLEKMAEIAACEIEGVSGISKQKIDIGAAFRSKSAFKGVTIEDKNGAVSIDIYISVKKDVKVREVAEAVQKNVKDKIQTMTGTFISKVNVEVADIDVGKKEPQTEEENK